VSEELLHRVSVLLGRVENVRRVVVAVIVRLPVTEAGEDAYGREAKVLAVEIAERETIICALDDPLRGSRVLRAVLLQEHVARVLH
jgi:hypothetical protein